MSTPDVGTPQLETPMDWQEWGAEANEWEKRYKDLQAQYTKTAQELADERKRLDAGWEPVQNDDEKATIEWLNKHGFVTKNELEAVQKNVRMEQTFQDLLDNNPSLKAQEKAIRALQQNDWRDFEAVAIDYWFITADKLEKAKAGMRKMVGGVEPQQERRIADMTTAEYLEWKKKAGITGGTAKTMRPSQ